MKPFFGGKLAKHVGTDALARYIESRRGEKAANGSINRELSLLQRAFMLGYESQPRKVVRPLRFHRLAESKPRQGFIEQKQYDALAANCSDLYMRAMLCLGYSFGFRKSELLTLKVLDVDLMADTIRLRDSKNGEPRKVALTRDARMLLAACVVGKRLRGRRIHTGSEARCGLSRHLGQDHSCGRLPGPALPRPAPFGGAEHDKGRDTGSRVHENQRPQNSLRL